MLGNRQYCYPLTISDYRSRYLIACEGVKSTKADLAFTVHQVGLEKALADTAAAKADYIVVVDLAESKTASKEVSRLKVASRHYSHSVYRANPRYDQARKELEQAQDNLNATIRSQKGSGVKIKGGGNEAAIAGLLAHLIGVAVNNSQIGAAEDKVAAAQEKLDATPRISASSVPS